MCSRGCCRISTATHSPQPSAGIRGGILVTSRNHFHRFLSISTKIYGQTASVLKSLRTSSVLSPISRSLHPTSPCLGLKGDKRSIAITTANISLHDVNPRNGATEFWLGTHNGYSKADHSSPTTGWIKHEVFNRRAKISPPVQPAISKGSLVIRDLRCWHAGRENHTDDPRIILGFLYSPRWFGSRMRMLLPSSARPLLQSWTHIDCLQSVDFVAGRFDYLHFLQDINLSRTPSQYGIPYVSKPGAVTVTAQDYWTPP
jgi:hypothetical protein